ncbi:MAG TPA: hypothetical protein VMR51_02145 [Patescibacteria group bacterium]|nr:hypothetical protein [Patescibacteria group bacterium]
MYPKRLILVVVTTLLILAAFLSMTNVTPTTTATMHTTKTKVIRPNTPIYGKTLQRYIIKCALRFHVDPAATLAVACYEGGFTKPKKAGDGGTSFGPWQLHRRGRLPSGIKNPQQWAFTPNGVKYAICGQAQYVRGMHGYAATSRIVCKFENPANESLCVRLAMSYYQPMKRLVKRLRQ